MTNYVGKINAVFSLLLLLAIVFTLSFTCSAAETRSAEDHVLLDRMLQPDLSDLDPAKRNFIRVLVSYSNTNFFVAKGQKHGLEYELLTQYEGFLNKKHRKSKEKFRVSFVALPFRELMPWLVAGKGDIVAAGLTITPEREKSVAFTDPYIRNVEEIVVTSQKTEKVDHLNDLSGRKVHVVSGSSYIDHLQRINERFRKEKRPLIKIVEADKTLEAEDLLQMINAGIFKITVVDRHIADFWAQVLPNLVLKENIVVNTGGNIAWAVRKSNPKLLASLNAFVKQSRQGTLLGNILIKRYYENTQWISNPVSESEIKRLNRIAPLIKKYAKKYNFYWLQIVALAYQESGLDNSQRSSSGAEGIMQIRPTTAADPVVGIPDISGLENNIHAGVKYLAFLRDRYFSDEKIEPAASVDFTFAAYNAGPRRINRLRGQAQKEGLDPNQWFFNVERLAQQDIGQETVQYVSNINKYFIAYVTIESLREERARETEKINRRGFKIFNQVQGQGG
ncbi:transporter substrate-binding domain-containing protein [Thermodesulfobacteriota bacterium]